MPRELREQWIYIICGTLPQSIDMLLIDSQKVTDEGNASTDLWTQQQRRDGCHGESPSLSAPRLAAAALLSHSA